MSTTVDVPESSNVAKGKAIAVAPPRPGGGLKKGAAIMDFILRLGAVAASLGAAATMGTSDQTLPFFTQFFQFEASYDSFTTFQYVTIQLFMPFLNMHIYIHTNAYQNAGFLSLQWHSWLGILSCHYLSQ